MIKKKTMMMKVRIILMIMKRITMTRMKML